MTGLPAAESTNRAHVEAEHLLREVLAYCENVAHRNDIGWPYTAEISTARRLLDRLQEVHELLTAGFGAQTSPEVLDVLKEVEQHVFELNVRSELAADLGPLQRLLRTANE